MSEGRIRGFTAAVEAVDENLADELMSSSEAWCEMSVHGLARLAQGLKGGPYRPEAELLWAAVIVRPTFEALLWSDLLAITQRVYLGDRGWDGIAAIDEDDDSGYFMIADKIAFQLVEAARQIIQLHATQTVEKASSAWTVKGHRRRLQDGIDRGREMEQQLVNAGLEFARDRLAHEVWPIENALKALDKETQS